MSRRRRQAGYAAFAAGYALLRPALRRLAGTSLLVLVAVAVAVVIHF